MKVEWTEHASASFIEEVMNTYPESNSSDFDSHFKGEVIGAVQGTFGTTYLIVACEDRKIRKCEMSTARICDEK